MNDETPPLDAASNCSQGLCEAIGSVMGEMSTVVPNKDRRG